MGGAGPLTTRLMANFGAEVIKVESGGARMDPLRVQMVGSDYNPDLPDLLNDVNTGKQSITIDLANKRGKDLLRQLVAHCDVMVNNYSGGSLARMGFPWKDLREINPRLINVHLPGIRRRQSLASAAVVGQPAQGGVGDELPDGFPRPSTAPGWASPIPISPRPMSA